MKVKSIILILFFFGAVYKMHQNLGKTISVESCIAITFVVLIALGFICKNLIIAFRWFIKYFTHGLC